MKAVDEYFMSQALSIAGIVAGQSSPNPPVGAIIVKDGRIVGQGAHLSAGGPHAEVHAIQMAGELTQGSTLYVTLEPCNHYGRTPPCTEAILRSGIKRVVVGSVDPNPSVAGHGLERLREAGVEVTVGVEKEQADNLNRAFFHSVMTKRPFVIWKSAVTLDGYIAAQNGESRFVTGDLARSYVQQLRRETPAIAVGIGTVLADNPRLTVRDDSGPVSNGLQPKRIVFDSKLRIPNQAALLHEPGQSVVFTTVESFERKQDKVEQLKSISNVTIIPVSSDGGRVSLEESLGAILEQCGAMSLLIEGGSTLVSSLFEQQFIDKIVYFIAPKLLGGGIPVLTGRDTVHMRDAISLEHVTQRFIGADICIEGFPVYNKESL